MILEGILKEMANRVYGLGFISKSGALVYEANATNGGIMTNAQVAPFTDPRLVDVSPGGRENGISFFKAGATQVISQDSYLTIRQNDIVFTAWINGDRVKTSDTDIEEQIVKVLRTYRVPIEQGSPIRMVEIEYLGDNEGTISRYGNDVANRWGWDKGTLRYNEPPHILFQHNFRIKYVVSSGCYSQTVQVINPSC